MPITRRAALAGLGASVSLPLLESLAPAATAGNASAATPRRLVYLYFPNGVPDGTWFPTSDKRTGRIEQLNPWMKPLEPFRDQLVLPRGLTMPRGEGHVAGPPNWLTGLGYEGEQSRALGVSVDQAAAAKIGKQTLLPSLELALEGEGFFSGSLPRNAISWSATGAPLPREVEPRAVFDRMFPPPGGGTTSRSVLDGVVQQARGLRREVGTADLRKLDEYFESVRSLERRIAFAERRSREAVSDRGETDTLVRPKAGVPVDHEEYIQQMMDLLVLALRTDATRVATFMLDHGQSNRYFNFINGVRGTWHALSHYKDASGKTEDDDGSTKWGSVREKRAMYAEVNRWHHKQLAYLLGKLNSIREPGGTMLDSTVVVYGSSLGDGHMHGNDDLPTLIAGGRNAGINTGRVVAGKRRDLCSVHAAALSAVCGEPTRFGASEGPMSELLL
ncbi:MAG: DUF1552 domain-containing protein [Planctomycetota bacterium]